MSNIHTRDYKPPTNRFNSTRVSGFHDEKLPIEPTQSHQMQKDSRHPKPKLAEQPLSSSRDHTQQKKVGENDRAQMGNHETYHQLSDSKPSKPTAGDKEMVVDRETKPTNDQKEDHVKKEDGPMYSRFGQANGTQYQTTIFDPSKQEKHDFRSYSVKRSPSRPKHRFMDSSFKEREGSPFDRKNLQSQPRPKNGEVERRDTSFLDAQVKIDKDGHSPSNFRAPGQVELSRQRCQSQSNYPQTSKMSESFQDKDILPNSSPILQMENSLAGISPMVTAQINQNISFGNINQISKMTSQPEADKKSPLKRLYLSRKSKQGFNSSKEAAIFKQFMSIEKFLDVSKVLLNKFVIYQEHIKQEYMHMLRQDQDKLMSKIDKQDQSFASETFSIFAMVIKVQTLGFFSHKDYMEAKDEQKAEYAEDQENVEMKEKVAPVDPRVGYNISSFKHSIKRIHKACQIQMEDFQWKNGPYSEKALSNSTGKGNKNEVESPSNADMIRQQTTLLQELIQVEQVCKLYIDLYKRNFIQLFELAKAEVIDIFTQESSHLKGQLQSSYMRFSNYSQVSELLKVNDKDPAKNINVCLLDIFTAQELKTIDSSNLMLISLLEIGNTIDGVTIASKTLSQIREKHEFNPTLGRNFSRFFNWKKRKCHCCMEYILDAGKAVTCFNLTNQENPCMKVYCQNCIISFMEEKHTYEETSEHKQDDKKSINPEESVVSLTEEEIKKNKEMETRKIKRKLWLKASQNVLFTCPCCQNFCLEEDLQQNKKTFSQFSMCNFTYKLENHPRSFLRKDIYLYMKNGVKKLFYLCKINGILKHKTLHRVEILQKSQTVPMKLSREEFFFTCTVKPDSKMFKIMYQQGFELDFKKQMDKYIKDFQDHSTFPLLEKYKNYLENSEVNKNEFIIPKFMQNQHNIRKVFIEKHRDLYRRFDNQLHIKLDLLCDDVLACKVSESSGDEAAMQEEQKKVTDSEIKKTTPSNEIESEVLLRSTSVIDDTIRSSKDEPQITQGENIENSDKANTANRKTEQQRSLAVRKNTPLETNLLDPFKNLMSSLTPTNKKVVEKPFIVEKTIQNEQPKKPLSIDQPMPASLDDSHNDLLLTMHEKDKTSKLTPPQRWSQSAQKEQYKPERKAYSYREQNQSVDICKLTKEELENFEINSRLVKQIIPKYCPPNENIGNLIVREKNIMLAKDHNMDLGENFLLLITKEVFIIEKEQNRCQLPFTQTYIFSNIPNDCLTYKWPFSTDEKSECAPNQPKEVPVIPVAPFNEIKETKDHKEKTITFRIKEVIPSDDDGQNNIQDQIIPQLPAYRTLDMKPMTLEQKVAFLHGKPPTTGKTTRAGQLAQQLSIISQNTGPKEKQIGHINLPKLKFIDENPKQQLKMQEKPKMGKIMSPTYQMMNYEVKDGEPKISQDVQDQPKFGEVQRILDDFQNNQQTGFKTTQPNGSVNDDSLKQEQQKRTQLIKDPDSQPLQIIQIQNNEDNQNSHQFVEDEAYMEYLKELEQADRKEYNLRKNANTRSFQNTYNEKQLQKRQNQPLSLRNQIPVAEDGYYDDFPIDIIKQFGLKVSTKIKSPVYKRQKLSDDVKKVQHMTMETPMTPGRAIISPADQNSDSIIKKESPGKELGFIQSGTENSQLLSQRHDEKDNFYQKPMETVDQQVMKNPVDIPSVSIASGNPSGNQNESSKKDTELSTNKLKKDSFNCKQFIVTEKLQEHFKHVLKIVEESPERMENMYVFILFKKKQYWKRVFIQNYIPPKDDEKDKRLFNAIFQEKERRKVQINLLKSMFIIDCRYGDQSSGEQQSQNDQEKMVKADNGGTLYNDRSRVQKLLKKRNEKEQSQLEVAKKDEISEIELSKPAVKSQSLNDEPIEMTPVQTLKLLTPVLAEPVPKKAKELTIKENSIQISVVKQDVTEITGVYVTEAVQQRFQRTLEMNQAVCMELNISNDEPREAFVKNDKRMKDNYKPLTPIKNESSLASSEPIEVIKRKEPTGRKHRSDSNSKMTKAEEKQRATPNINPVVLNQDDHIEVTSTQTVHQHQEPKPEWVKHMKLQILTKSRDNMKKTLKFYHHEINDQEFSSADEEDQTKQGVSASSIDNKNNDQTQKIQSLMTQIQQKQYKNSELEQQLNFNQELQKLQDQQQLNFQLRTQQLVQQQQDIAQQLQNSTFEQKKQILQKLENENLLIEKKKNQLFHEIQNMKILSDTIQFDPYELQAKLDEKQKQINQLMIMQQLLEQIYRHQTSQLMYNTNLYPQDVVGFQQIEQMNPVVDQQMITADEGQHVMIEEINQDMQPPDALQEVEEPKHDSKHIQTIQDSIQQQAIVQTNQMASEQQLDIKIQQQNDYPQDQPDQQENYVNTYDHQSEQFAMNEANLEYMRNMQQQQQQQFISQQPVAYYFIPQGQQYPQHQQQVEYQQQPIEIEQVEQQVPEEVQVMVEEEEEIPVQCEAYLAQLQAILNKIENLDQNWEQILNDNNTFTIIEKGIQLLEFGYQHEKSVEEEIILQMNIQNQLQEVDLIDSDIQIGLLINDEHSSFNYQQHIEDQFQNEDVIPDFFINHISQLANLKKQVFGNTSDPHTKLSQLQQVMDSNNMQGGENNNVPFQPSLENMTKPRLYGILMKFYNKSIVQKCLKKCSCAICIKMVFPMLIRFNTESNSFQETHYMMQQQFSMTLSQLDQMQPLSVTVLLQMFLTEQKTPQTMQQDALYQQYKMMRHQSRPNPESSAFSNQYPCFQSLIERQQEEAVKQINIDNSEDEYSKLPKMSTILKAEKTSHNQGSDNQDPRIIAFKNTHKQLRENIKNFLDYYNIYRK